ncbi:MAG: NAD(P)-dependent oxidoreductase [Janthinobacterium lividum]
MSGGVQQAGSRGNAKVCLIAEPIHSAGIEALIEAGITVRWASSPELICPTELQDAHAIVVRSALTAATITMAPRLVIIANHGTGTDSVDVAFAHSRGIPVSVTPDANVASVAEHAIMLMLAAARQAPAADRAARSGDVTFRFEVPMHGLYEKTLGIIGFGRTGRRLALLARGLQMKIVVWSPRSDPAEIERAGCVALPNLESLLEVADVVTIHRPLREDTRHTLNKDAIERMKLDAIVVNTSRGALIDEIALAEALSAGRLHSAGLDVFEVEPLSSASPIANAPRVVLSPHVAGSAQQALKQTALECARSVIDAVAGRCPKNLLDASVWDSERSLKVLNF